MTDQIRREITLTVVSHGQADLIRDLLKDIDASATGYFLKEVIVTSNIREEPEFQLKSAPLRIIINNKPKGFGANHNSAFVNCRSDFFCVLNPDIRFKENPFPKLLQHIKSRNLSVVGPRVINPKKELEDNARPFPNPLTIFRKFIGNKSAALYPHNVVPDSPDWIAGMFMLFNAKAFAEVSGFDERYFLYYEDADICARLKLAGGGVGYCKDVEVIHDARRDSHRKLRYLKWHLSSMLRFFIYSGRRSINRRP